MTITEERTADLIGYFATGSPEWHAARADGIGGSEIAAVLGLSKWESPFSLWHRKQGRLAVIQQNEQMEWGHRLEPAICKKYEDIHPDVEIVTAGTYRHRERPWQIANPDRLVYDSGHLAGLFEAKTARDDTDWGQEGTDEIPVYYRAQALWYLDVFGLNRLDLGVLIAGSDYREYVIKFDPADALIARTAAEKFLDSIRLGERPAIDASDATYAAVRQLHPDIDPVDVDIPPDLAVRYVTALDDLAGAESEKQLACALVMDAVGSGRRAMFLGDPVAIRVPNGKNPPYLRASRKGAAK